MIQQTIIYSRHEEKKVQEVFRLAVRISWRHDLIEHQPLATKLFKAFQHDVALSWRSVHCLAAFSFSAGCVLYQLYHRLI